MKDRVKDILGLVVSLGVCYGAAAVGGLSTAGAVKDWYLALAKPPWTPPAWVFGPVWTVLYGMMAAAAWLIWRQRHQRRVAVPIILFAVQLALNSAWSPLFFGLRHPGLALADIVLLWLALAATVWLFLKRRLVAGVLLAPYLLWVSFAAALNLAIWRMNL
jgi:tryptophan-rich sensory protein